MDVDVTTVYLQRRTSRSTSNLQSRTSCRRVKERSLPSLQVLGSHLLPASLVLRNLNRKTFKVNGVSYEMIAMSVGPAWENFELTYLLPMQ